MSPEQRRSGLSGAAVALTFTAFGIAEPEFVGSTLVGIALLSAAVTGVAKADGSLPQSGQRRADGSRLRACVDAAAAAANVGAHGNGRTASQAGAAMT